MIKFETDMTNKRSKNQFRPKTESQLSTWTGLSFAKLPSNNVVGTAPQIFAANQDDTSADNYESTLAAI